jgi:hypothetical protein
VLLAVVRSCGTGLVHCTKFVTRLLWTDFSKNTQISNFTLVLITYIIINIMVITIIIL